MHSNGPQRVELPSLAINLILTLLLLHFGCQDNGKTHFKLLTCVDAIYSHENETSTAESLIYC